MANTLLLGCGDLGTRLGIHLLKAGHEVFAARRNIAKLPSDFKPVQISLNSAENCSEVYPNQIHSAYFMAAPNQSTEEAYRECYVEGLKASLAALHSHTIQRFYFVSSTSVYAQDKGEEINEKSPTEPSSFRGQIMLEAEQLLDSAPWPTTKVRLSGIYGPGRTHLLDRVRKKAPLTNGGRITNRIHVEDAARFLAFLMQYDKHETCYLLSDDEPVRADIVYSELAKMLSVKPSSSLDGSDLPEAGKRCMNLLVKQTGFKLLYPSFREGYAELLRS